MNKDQTKGHFKEMKGTAKEVAGKVVGNRELEQEGKLQNASGKIQTAYGDMKREFKKAR